MLLLFLSPPNTSAVILKRNFREMGQAIALRLILTGPLAQKSTPRFRRPANEGLATYGKVAPSHGA
jgi:hypothetical protein